MRPDSVVKSDNERVEFVTIPCAIVRVPEWCVRRKKLPVVSVRFVGLIARGGIETLNADPKLFPFSTARNIQRKKA